MDTIQRATRSGRLVPVLVMDADEFRQTSDDFGGFCLACGWVAEGVEPDARGYECEDCGAAKVYGLEEALIMGRVEIGGGDADHA